MKDITRGTVIDNHHLTQIRLDAAEIFDVVAASKCTVLSIVSSDEIFPILLQPVNDRIGVLLYRRRKNDQLVPFTDLSQHVS